MRPISLTIGTRSVAGFTQLIDVLGADHGGYVKRIKAVVAALSDNKVTTDIKLIQLVKLWKNGEPFKMSKRAGTFVTLRDVVEQAGADVTRFHMLTRKNDAPLDFDFDKVLEQSKDNPVFYVQYAHARIRSVARKARGHRARRARSCGPAEMKLARTLAEFPRVVEIAAKAHEPHRIAFYLYDVAQDLHALWNKRQRNARIALPAGRSGTHCGENRPALCNSGCDFGWSCYSWRQAGRGNAINFPAGNPAKKTGTRAVG